MDNTQKKLDALKTVLRELEAQTPSSTVQFAINTLRKYMDVLTQDLKQSQEQSRLAALYRVSQVLGTSLHLDEVLNQVMDAVISLTKAERGFLVLVEPDTMEWKLRVARNFSQETLERREMEVSDTLIRTVVESGQGVVTTDAQTDPRFATQESVVYYALRSIMCAPLLSRGQVIGVIYVDNRTQVGLFVKDDLEMLNALAVPAAVVIENARLYTQTDQALTRRVAELETLAVINRELNTRLDLNHALQITQKWALQEIIGAEVWVLFTEKGDLNPEDTLIYPEQSVDLSDAMLLDAMQDASPQLSAPIDGLPARLVAPIVHGGHVLGAIVALRKQPFSQSNLQFVTHLAGRAASAFENARLYQAVQQANQAKTKFISVVSHELRIPMTSIKGYSDLLRQGVVGEVNEQQVNFLDVIRGNVERMSALVSDLSDISRIETGRLKLECEMISVQSYIDEVVNSLRPRLDEKLQSLDVTVPPNLAQVYADPNRLVQVLTNLLSNASKYTPVEGNIHVTAKQKGDRVHIEVKDSGIGISPEDQIKIFSQFFRSEDPSVRNEQGWGLGLNVTKQIVELMGGEIGFVSVVGGGSTFYFWLSSQAKE